MHEALNAPDLAEYGSDVISHASQVPSRLLMGPGPANAHPRVLAAQSLPMLGARIYHSNALEAPASHKRMPWGMRCIVWSLCWVQAPHVLMRTADALQDTCTRHSSKSWCASHALHSQMSL